MILPLETFRGIFALIIVLHHLKIDTFIQKSNIVMNGGLVVDFFFVLSGFVISLNYLNKINSKKDLLNFQKKRFNRLYPLHLLTLFMFIIIEIIKLIINNYTNLQSTYVPFSGFNNFYSLIANFFLLHGWYGWSFNLPSWSISTEFYTYLIFGLVVLFFNKRTAFFVFLILFSLTVFLLNNSGLNFLENFIYPTRCIYSFFIGVITYLAFKKFKNNYSNYISLILIVFINGCAGYKPIFNSSSLMMEIKNHSIEGDKKLGERMYLKLSNLLRSGTKESKKNIDLFINISKNKESTIKDKSGKILEYKITLNTIVIVKNYICYLKKIFL